MSFTPSINEQNFINQRKNIAISYWKFFDGTFLVHTWYILLKCNFLFFTFIFRKATAEKCIIAGAKLISPVIESSFDIGFDWLVDHSILVLAMLYGILMTLWCQNLSEVEVWAPAMVTSQPGLRSRLSCGFPCDFFLEMTKWHNYRRDRKN